MIKWNPYVTMFIHVFFMVKQGFEIGQYKNGKVLINMKISHSQEKCIANEIYNNDSDFYI